MQPLRHVMGAAAPELNVVEKETLPPQTLGVFCWLRPPLWGACVPPGPTGRLWGLAAVLSS